MTRAAERRQEVPMSEQAAPEKVADQVVVSLDYTLTVDGEVLDSSEKRGPIQFIQGNGDIIPGLEGELYEMGVGDSKQVGVAAKDGYGEYDPDAKWQVDKTEIPAEIDLEVGTELQVQDEEGEWALARVVSMGKEHITLDGNHPLAGKDLDFQVTVVALRHATEDELAHGHVHTEGGHGH
jgi:FKBP-type peptidyl-prolyl cis-trans isomerase SlyD